MNTLKSIFWIFLSIYCVITLMGFKIQLNPIKISFTHWQGIYFLIGLFFFILYVDYKVKSGEAYKKGKLDAYEEIANMVGEELEKKSDKK